MDADIQGGHMNRYDQIMNRAQWFRDARFGMFIHFGLYAIPARGEWVRSAERLGIEDYRTYFEEFDPDAIDLDYWMHLAVRAGMKYVVLTAKHHDGFCLFDSNQTDYKVTNTPHNQDIIANYVDAARRYGLRVGLYYSLVDWHHPDYPAFGDRQHPHQDNKEWKRRTHHWDKYLEYMHKQVEELITHYGTIDFLWFDFSYWHMKGEAWEATKLVEMIRSHQPSILINNRLGGNMFTENPDTFCGDFASPEQMIPQNHIVDYYGRPLPWEACITLNDSWGFVADDRNWKSSEFVIQTLVNCLSKSGNLLVNVGPDARGRYTYRGVEHPARHRRVDSIMVPRYISVRIGTAMPASKSSADPTTSI